MPSASSGWIPRAPGPLPLGGRSVEFLTCPTGLETKQLQNEMLMPELRQTEMHVTGGKMTALLLQ